MTRHDMRHWRLSAPQNGFTVFTVRFAVFKNTSTTEEKEFLLICKGMAIAEELDNCVTGAGVSYFCCHLCFHSTFIISLLVQMKSVKVVTVKPMYLLLLLRAILDCCKSFLIGMVANSNVACKRGCIKNKTRVYAWFSRLMQDAIV